MKHLKTLAAAALAVGALGTTASAQQGLLISEFVVTPTDGEFVEIYNSTGAAIDLTDVYLSDATFGGGGVFYYNIVIGNPGGGSFGDFTARFPAGASIGSGEYQTVALNGSDAFFAEYGVDCTYEIAEDGLVADAIPDMLEAVPGSINSSGDPANDLQAGLTNGDEIVILFAWDGVSDLVTDLDQVNWGGSNEKVDKTGVSIDGPDADTDTSTYADELPFAEQDDAASPGSGSSAQRINLSEGLEEITGGNGATGADETTENVSATFATAAPTPNAAAVGSTTVIVAPGVQGVANTFSFGGANPGDMLFLFFGFDTGVQPLPQCPDLALNVALGGSSLLITRVADGAGEYSFGGDLPDVDMDLFIQVVSAGMGGADCRITNLALAADG
ncbi:MAG: hypothetical protein DHS20C15_05250 [Planctomycetota bacterium]|nr:MAG: hypothetical protein DHS20C15_05250 [Planctomycetota bacterium]